MSLGSAAMGTAAGSGAREFSCLGTRECCPGWEVGGGVGVGWVSGFVRTMFFRLRSTRKIAPLLGRLIGLGMVC